MKQKHIAPFQNPRNTRLTLLRLMYSSSKSVRYSNLVDKADDIERALQAGAYLSAFALALTVPDICSKIEYPGLKVGERYKKWMDEHYVRWEQNPKLREQGAGYESLRDLESRLDGNFYYQVRCSYLHSGNTDVSRCNIDSLNLILTLEDYEITSVSDPVPGSLSQETEPSKVYTLSIPLFCMKMCGLIRHVYAPMADDPDMKTRIEDHSFLIRG